MMRHPRDIIAKKAELDLSTAAMKIRDEVDMTDIEYLQWLASEQQSVLKFMLRYERHGNYDQPAGLA